MRFLFYSHDGSGLGHTCRNLAVARSLTGLGPRAAVLVASGSDDVMRLGVPDRVEILKLPGLRKLGNESYAARHLGVSSRHVRRLRGRLLVSAVESFRPAVLLVDKHPFGAGGELGEALAALRKSGGKAVLGLRDILDEPATVRAEWQSHQLPQTILDHYDSVLVYGQRDLFDPAAAYGFPPELARRTRFCGYVSNCACATVENGGGFPPPPKHDPDHPLVLATVGGGEDGFQLLESFLLACGGGGGWRNVAVSGPMMHEDQHARLARFASDFGVDLYSFVPGLNNWFAAAAAVVCMGGYNTIAQALEAATPVVCVPRVEPRREQLVRAEAFARRRLLRLVTPNQLSPERLRREIGAALATSRAELRARIQATVQFNGADIAAEHLLALARTAGVRPRHHSQHLVVAR
jgi:predicted glycosyltransferase